MKSLELTALGAAKKDGGTILILLRNERTLSFVTSSSDFHKLEKLFDIAGTRGHILFVEADRTLLSVDDNLILFTDVGYEIVLRAHRPENYFWHACYSNGTVFVQEYGLCPTSIYASTNLSDWKEVISNLDVDPYSKHFHNIVFDPYQNQLIATLGDGNFVRVITSVDNGNSWIPLFRGAWQFLPIVPLENKVVFGMDSALTRGGLGFYDYTRNRWMFLFLRWLTEEVKLAQFYDLKRLSNGLWIATLGNPKIAVISEDLQNWSTVYIQAVTAPNSEPITICEFGKTVVLCTAQKLLVYELDELKDLITCTVPVMEKYSAYSERFRGALWKSYHRLKAIL
jgi:hypothetical protein